MTTWIITKLATMVGERYARPLAIGIIVLLVIGGAFLIGYCSKDDYEDDYKAQIDQTNRSAAAASDAAKAAVEILEGRTATENAVDQIVSQTVKQIDQAVDTDQIRAAVLAGVCKTAEHRNDPACVANAESRQ